MPGAFKSRRIQGAANAARYLMTHLRQVNLREDHEAQWINKPICLLSISAVLDGSGCSMPRSGHIIPEKESRYSLYRKLGYAPGPVW
jgi:hypothetical protein